MTKQALMSFLDDLLYLLLKISRKPGMPYLVAHRRMALAETIEDFTDNLGRNPQSIAKHQEVTTSNLVELAIHSQRTVGPFGDHDLGANDVAGDNRRSPSSVSRIEKFFR